MAVPQRRTGRGAIPGALTSLLLGLMAFGIITVSIDWVAKSSLADYLLFNAVPIGAPHIPLALLFAAMAVFLLGLVGLVIGCSCLPDGSGEPRGRLCTWFAGTGIGVSLVTILIDFGMISVLRLFMTVP